MIKINKKSLSIAAASFAFVVLSSFAFTHAAKAASTEPICPGGSAPRSDIVVCEDFENPSDTTYPAGSIVNTNGAAAGNYYLQRIEKYGAMGGGYYEPSLPSGTWSTKINERFYVRFRNGRISYDGGHGPGPDNYYGALFVEMAQAQPYLIFETGQTPGSYDLMENQPSRAYLTDNAWHLMEIHAEMDTACTDSTKAHGCNGIMQLFVDGQKVMEYTDLNFGGVLSGAKWRAYWSWRDYYHPSNPWWNPEYDFDNFAISNTGQYIGPAQNQNSLGTPDTVSPYYNYATMWPMYSPGSNDCQNNHNSTQSWRGYDVGVDAFDGTLTHGAYPGACMSGQDGSLKVATNATSTYGGLENLKGVIVDNLHPQHQVTIHGFIYPAAGNDYSTNPALSGIMEYDVSNNGRYVAMGVANGKWALVQRGKYSNGTDTVLATSNVAVTAGQWTEFQFTLYDDNTTSLMINRSVVLNKIPLAAPIDFFTGGGFGGNFLLGVIDNQKSSQLTVNYDEVSEGDFSWWNCDGWDPSSCPFSGSTPTPTPTPTPAPTPDTTAPTVSITGPNPGSTISGSAVTFSAVAADNVGVAGVQFKVDGTNYGAEQVSAPYQVSLDTTKLSNGTHTLSATARDAAGNTATSSAVTVTVSNTTIPPSTGSCPTSIPTGSFLGCYYTGMNFNTFALSRNDPAINFDWSTTSPDPSIPTTVYSVRWQGSYNFEATNYTFTATGDDGVRLYIDGTLVIDKWINQAATTYTYSQDMTAGAHLIKFEYFQNTGYAVSKLSWAKTATTTPPPVVTPPPTPTTTVVVDSTYSGYDKKYINDGIINASAGTTGTWASGESSTSPHFIEFDLPSSTQVNNALISWAYNTYQKKYMASNLVQVQTKDSSGNWVTQGTINYSGDNPTSSVAFNPVTTSAIRFYQPANEGNPSYTTVMWVTEVSYSYDPSKTPVVVTPPPTSGGGGTPPPVVTPPVVTPPASNGAGGYIPSTPQTPTTPSSSYATGSLINDHGTIYLIRGGFKIGFTNANAFLSLGYKFSDVTNGDTSNIPSVSGYTINSPQQAHPWGSWLLYNHTVYYVTQLGMIGVPSLAVLQSNGGALSQVLPANAADIQIINSSQLPVMTTGDGRVMH